MKMYDRIIGEIEELLPENKKIMAGAAKDLSANSEINKFKLILKKEMAYELGGNGCEAIGGIGFTSDKSLCDEDKIIVIGKDLGDIKKDCDFARITIVRIKDENYRSENTDESQDESFDNKQKNTEKSQDEGLGNKQENTEKSQDEGSGNKQENTDELYRMLKNIDYTRFHTFPDGFMIRISTAGNRESVRVSKKAVKSGMNFEKVGNIFLKEYHKIPMVEAVKIIFITAEDFDYQGLSEKCEKMNQITESLNKILGNLVMDCGTCNYKEICDEVDGMKELHFKRTN